MYMEMKENAKGFDIGNNKVDKAIKNQKVSTFT